MLEEIIKKSAWDEDDIKVLTAHRESLPLETLQRLGWAPTGTPEPEPTKATGTVKVVRKRKISN